MTKSRLSKFIEIGMDHLPKKNSDKKPGKKGLSPVSDKCDVFSKNFFPLNFHFLELPILIFDSTDGLSHDLKSMR
jgi:hypothetical protein